MAEILTIRKLDWKMIFCLFVSLFAYRFVCFYFNHHRMPKGSFTQNFAKIGLDLADILRISKLDWHDGEGEKKGRRRGGILLCNGLITNCTPILFLIFISDHIFQ